jgi:hypothetical protein
MRCVADLRPGGDRCADDVRRRSRLRWSRDPAGDHRAYLLPRTARELPKGLVGGGFACIERRRRHLGFERRAQRAPQALRAGVAPIAAWYLVRHAYA